MKIYVYFVNFLGSNIGCGNSEFHLTKEIKNVNNDIKSIEEKLSNTVGCEITVLNFQLLRIEETDEEPNE